MKQEKNAAAVVDFMALIGLSYGMPYMIFFGCVLRNLSSSELAYEAADALLSAMMEGNLELLEVTLAWMRGEAQISPWLATEVEHVSDEDCTRVLERFQERIRNL